MRSIQKIADTFERDARFWGLTPTVALIIAIIPIIVVLGMVAAVRSPKLYVWLTAEDSLLEWTQFVLIFAASLIFAWSSILLFQNQQRKMAVLYLLVAFGTFFVAGEEIAWGQRIFGWTTPEALEAVNSQHETTLHNIGSAHPIFIYGTMIAGLYGVLIPMLASVWRNEKRESVSGHLLIPPLCLIPAFLMPFVYRFSRLALGVDALFPKLIFAITKFSEVTEVCLYFALMIFAGLNLRYIEATIPSHSRKLISGNHSNH